MIERIAIICATIGISMVLVVWQYLAGRSRVARARASDIGDHNLLAETVFHLLEPAVIVAARFFANVPSFFRHLWELVGTCGINLVAPVTRTVSQESQDRFYLSPGETSKRMFRLFLIVFVSITLANKTELITIGVPAHYKSIGENKVATETFGLIAELLSLVRYLAGLIFFVALGWAWKSLGIIRPDKTQDLSAYLMYEYNAVFLMLTGAAVFFLLFLSGFDGTERPIRATFSAFVAIGIWAHFGWAFHRVRVKFGGSTAIGWLAVVLTSLVACVGVYVLWLLGLVVFTLSR